jgi:hypothetical protein
MLLCSLGIRFASSRAAGAQLLPRRRPTWWLEAREDRKQQNGKEKEQSVWTVLFLWYPAATRIFCPTKYAIVA